MHNGLFMRTSTSFAVRLFCYSVSSSWFKGVGFRIHSANGAELVSYINVANDTSGAWPEVCPMGGGHFYMIWHVSATIKCALFDKMGVIIGSITTLDTACITSGRVPWHSCVPLGNGHCFIGWGRSTGLVGQIIHGETGALIGSLITLDSKANCGFHCGAPCENGDFLHACWSPNDGYHVIYRYTNEGVRVWGPQRPCAGTSLWTDRMVAFVIPGIIVFSRCLQTIPVIQN